MSLERITVTISVLLAILAAFAPIPSVGIAFAILGLIAGCSIAREDHVSGPSLSSRIGCSIWSPGINSRNW